MKKEIGGKTYVQVPEEEMRSCRGCAARGNIPFCGELHEGNCVNIIWKEQTMSEKREQTALGLVDELIAMMGCQPPGQLIKLKSAIERERQQAVDDWAAKSVELVQSEKLRETEKLLSAKRETEMKETIGNLESKVKSHTQTIQEMNDRLKSAIVMRPISELPYNVPDGCVIVAVGKLRGTIKCWVWEHGDDAFPHEGETHFYILPLPKPARRLHPCYMPGCGNEVVVLRDGEDGYRVECRKCGSTGPLRASKEGAEQSWGYAE